MNVTPGPGTRAVVFGASSGIGAAVASVLAAAGTKVVAASRRATTPAAGEAEAVRCDVREAGQVAGVLRRLDEDGGVDWIVNAAGVGFYAPIRGEFSAQWRDIVETNILGTLNVLAQARSLARQPGHIVQIGSLAGSRPSRTPGNDVYAATKAGGAQLLLRHREQLRRDGIRTRMTLITPGYVGDTDFTRNYYAHATEHQQPLLDQFPPLSPDDVARVVVHALSQPEHIELSEIVVRPVGQPD